jgi:hypothetical protein
MWYPDTMWYSDTSPNPGSNGLGSLFGRPDAAPQHFTANRESLADVLIRARGLQPVERPPSASSGSSLEEQVAAVEPNPQAEPSPLASREAVDPLYRELSTIELWRYGKAPTYRQKPSLTARQMLYERRNDPEFVARFDRVFGPEAKYQ